MSAEVTRLDSKRRCRKDDCTRVAYNRGLCQPCYRQAVHDGTLPARGEAYGEVTLPDMAAIGCSYRQWDYWTRLGLIKTEDGDTTPGSGKRRYWPKEEIDVAARMVRLIKAGLDVRVAAQVARQPDEPYELAEGVVITIMSEPADSILSQR